MVNSSNVWEVKVAGLGEGRASVGRGRDKAGTTPGCRVGGAVEGVLVTQGAGRAQTLTITDALTYESLPREFRYSAW